MGALLGAVLGTMMMGFFICIGFWLGQKVTGFMDAKFATA